MKRYLLPVFIILSMTKAFSQNIGINATGATPHTSAMLDVSATNKGFLMPRMTTAQRTAIAAPAEGLKVYDTNTKSFWFFNGTGWIEISSGSATNYWALNGTHIFNNNTGNVGIGINTSPDKLTVVTAADNFGITHTDGNIIVSTFVGGSSGGGWIGTKSNHSFSFYTNNSSPQMTIATSGNVGIGTVSPVVRLTIKTPDNSYGIAHTAESGGIIGTYIGGTSAGIGTFSNTNMRIFSNNTSAVFINASNNYVGLGIDFPANKLQIGSMGASGFATNDFAIGNGTDAMAIQQTNTGTLWGSTTDIVLRPRNNGNGYVGINTLTPSNKLQIGSVGATGFATNDLAIGNGTAAMAIFQTNTSTLIGSTTDIILKPGNNGQGRVGINTNSPRASLDVVNAVGVSTHDYSYIYEFSGNSYGNQNGEVCDCFNCTPLISIYASNGVLATEFDAYSDARIKNIVGISNASKDLQIINALQITDYTFKDKVKNGNKSYKKVIAQQVEKFYPQVVSKHTDFIPNVYRLTDKIEKTANGYLLRFSGRHNISSNAKKLQVMLAEDKGLEQYDIIAVPSGNSVEIKADDIKADKIFVYGEEVDDFRTVG